MNVDGLFHAILLDLDVPGIVADSIVGQGKNGDLRGKRGSSPRWATTN